MTVSRRQTLASILSAALPVPALAAAVDSFPSKPVVVRVGFPAGGPTDASIRAATAVLQRDLGQPVLADNQPGANGSIATMAVLKAPPDGYTLLGTSGADFLMAPSIVATAKYRPEDFALLGVIAITDFILVCTPGLPVNNVTELLAHARRAGKPLSIAHWGTGSAPHLVAADFQARSGVKFLEVPYKGAAPTMTDVASGQVDLTFIPLAGAMMGMMQKKLLKPLGLAGEKRHPALPEVATISEVPALKGFEHTAWAGLLAPPRTPQAVVTKLTAAANGWIASSENLERITANASRRLDPMNVEQNAAFLRREQDKYARLARALKIEPQ